MDIFDWGNLYPIVEEDEDVEGLEELQEGGHIQCLVKEMLEDVIKVTVVRDSQDPPMSLVCSAPVTSVDHDNNKGTIFGDLSFWK